MTVALPSLLEMLPLVVLGAVLGLDTVSFPQAQLSRPIVAATLGGAFAGQVLAGLFVGVALEMIALETLPFGASRYPEWGSASVVGGALYAAQPSLTAGAMTCAVVAALATAWVGGVSMVGLRRLNARWARPRLAELAAGSRATVEGLQVGGLIADLVRGALLTLIALMVLGPIMHAALAHWSVDGRFSRAVLVGTAASVAVGAVWKIFHTTTGARWYLLGGGALGLLLARVLEP